MHLVARGVAPRERGDLSTRLGVGSGIDFDLLQARSEKRDKHRAQLNGGPQVV